MEQIKNFKILGDKIKMTPNFGPYFTIYYKFFYITSQTHS